MVEEISDKADSLDNGQVIYEMHELISKSDASKVVSSEIIPD